MFGSSIPVISYGISFILFLLFSLDSLQPDTIQEKIQVVTFSINNLAVRVLALVLSLSFLGKLSIWRVLNPCLVIPTNFNNLIFAPSL